MRVKENLRTRSEKNCNYTVTDTDRQTPGQTDRETQTDKQTDRETQTDTKTVSQTDRRTYSPFKNVANKYQSKINFTILISHSTAASSNRDKDTIPRCTYY